MLFGPKHLKCRNYYMKFCLKRNTWCLEDPKCKFFVKKKRVRKHSLK